MGNVSRWVGLGATGALMLCVFAAIVYSVSGLAWATGPVGWGIGVWDTFSIRRTLALPAGGTLRVSNHTGSIEIEGGGPPGQVELEATLRVTGTNLSQADAEAMIVTSSSGTEARVEVVGGSRLSRRFGGLFGGPRAQLRLRVPDGLILNASNSTGSITVRAASARTELINQTGSIRVVGFRGELTAATSTGSIEVTDAHLSGPLHLSSRTAALRFTGVPGPESSFRTNTGSVQLTLPADRAYRLTLPGTRTGSFKTDLPYSGGQIGTGTPVGDITIDVRTGGILIRTAQEG